MSKSGSNSSGTGSKDSHKPIGQTLKRINHSVDGKRIVPPPIPTKKK
ncbi:hypothetical protein [Bacillus sp. NRRL B-14911]|nr:hypothetical protein [Bacillus sp. NRRL B-14911]